MLAVISLLLPALIPSWRFFSDIAPSPRIEVCLLQAHEASAVQSKRTSQWTAQWTAQLSAQWQDFRPPPHTVSFAQMAARLFWNARRNEDLYFVSCAERFIVDRSPHCLAALERGIARGIVHGIGQCHDPAAHTHFRFRLVFLQRNGPKIVKDVEYVSAALALGAAQGTPHEL